MAPPNKSVGSANSSSSNDNNTNNNESNDNLCIVRFRPREDWRGEYGFDWVREGPEDYEEKRTHNRLTDNNGKELHHFNDIKQSILKNEDWRKKKRKSVLENVQKYYKMRYGKTIEDPYTPDQWESIYEAGADSDSRKKLVPADEPIEYLYAPEHVSMVKYHINRKVSNAWTCNVYYENMANGDKAAINADTQKLDCFIKVDTNEITSLRKNGDGDYKAFVYEEKSIDSSDLNSKARYKREYSYSKRELSLSQIIRYLIDGKKNGKIYDNSTYFYRVSDQDWFRITYNNPCYFEDDEDFRKIASYKRIQYIEKNVSYDLMYRSLNGIMYLTANIIDRMSDNSEATKKVKRYILKYKNGCLRAVKIGLEEEKTPNQLAKSELKRIESYIKEHGDVASNKNMTIDILSKYPEKDDVCVTIGYPGSIKEVPLNTELGFKKKKDMNDVEAHDQWYGKDIFSWQEAYEDSFTERDDVPPKIKRDVIEGKKKHYGISKRGKYVVPILSMGCDLSLEERTKFTFGGLSDAPQADPEKVGEYEIQLRIEGSCKTLKLTSDNEKVVVDQPIIQDPYDRMTLKVRYTGNEPCTAIIDATAVFEDGSESFAGALEVNTRLPQFMHICFVRLRLVEKPWPTELDNAIKNAKYALHNAMWAAGIVPSIKEKEINVYASEIEQFGDFDSNKWDHRKAVEGKQLDNIFIEKFDKLCKTNPLFRYKYVVFFFNGDFQGSTAAYAHCKELPSTGENLSYVVESQSFSNYKTEVYEVTHELLHRLRHPHNFQLYHSLDNKKVNTTPFCFEIRKTSNIMDYYSLTYSLHKFQWDLMAQALFVDNMKYLNKFRQYYLIDSEKTIKDL